MQLRFFAVLTCCVLLGAGCAVQRVAFQASPLQPAADGKVKVRVDQNQNTLVELELEHIAPAEKLWPPKSVYVVWAEDTEGGIFQLGQLRVNRKRKASLKGTTAKTSLGRRSRASLTCWPQISSRHPRCGARHHPDADPAQLTPHSRPPTAH